MTPQFEVHQQGNAGQVVSLINAAMDLDAAAGGATVDELSIVSVCGGRGTGKTTIIRQAQPTLRDAGHLVGDLLRPDLFARFESLSTALINEIRRAIKDTGRENETHTNGGEDITLDEWSQRLLRRAAIGRSADFLPGGSLDQYAVDDARASEVASSFVSEWAAYIDAVRPGRLLVIGAIDDLDLATERLPELFDDLRVLASVPGIAFLVGIDLEEARRVLSARQSASFGLPSPMPHRETSSGLLFSKAPPHQSTVDGQLTKLLRPDLRVFLRTLLPSERLDFRPIGEDKSIADLLKQFELGTELGTYEGTPDVASVFVRRSDGVRIPTPYASCLSSNRRRLTALHRQVSQLLQNFAPESSSFRSQSMLVRLLLDHGVEEGLRDSAMTGPTPADFLRFDDDEVGDPILIIDFSSLSYFVSVRDQAVVQERLPAPSAQADLPTISSAASGGKASDPGHQLSLLLPGRSMVRIRVGEGKSDDAGPVVSSALAYSLLMGRDFAINYGLPCAERVVGSPPFRGGWGRRLISVPDTDNEFLHLPMWDGELDYWLFDRAWSQVVKLAESSVADPADFGSAAVLDAWSAIMEIHEKRTTHARAPYSASISEGRTPQTEWFSEVMSAAGKVYAEATRATSVRATDFVHWFERGLVMSLHPLVLPETAIDVCWNLRGSFVDAAGRSAVALAGVLKDLRRRATRGLGEPWIEPLIHQMAMLGADEDADEFRGRHERQTRVRETRRAAPLGDLAVAGSPVSVETSDSASDVYSAVRREISAWVDEGSSPQAP